MGDRQARRGPTGRQESEAWTTCNMRSTREARPGVKLAKQATSERQGFCFYFLFLCAECESPFRSLPVSSHYGVACRLCLFPSRCDAALSLVTSTPRFQSPCPRPGRHQNETSLRTRARTSRLQRTRGSLSQERPKRTPDCASAC